MKFRLTIKTIGKTKNIDPTTNKSIQELYKNDLLFPQISKYLNELVNLMIRNLRNIFLNVILMDNKTAAKILVHFLGLN